MKDIKIRMENICKNFETSEMKTMALRNINLTIKKGDYTSISGPSGSGKSTLLSILGLLDSPSEGSYFIDGVDVSNLSLTAAAKIRCEKIGFIFQSFNLIDELSVFENIALSLRYRAENFTNSKIKEQVMNCLSKVDMTHRVNHKPNQLSGGQQQRIAIARALVGNPSIIFADEPTGNLDSKNSDSVMELLETLNDEGKTICLVTHDPRYADMTKTKLNLYDGQMMNTLNFKVA